jgi:CubicO group peptidase (beta-lactamase class C family)/predicted dienelactone hydrolase
MIMDTLSLTNSSSDLAQNTVGSTYGNASSAHTGLSAAADYGLTFAQHQHQSLSYGTDASDLLKGDRTTTMLYGLDGNDTILGAFHQSNVLFGNSGKDQIQGGRKHDVLNGGSHRDRLIGNGGDDLLVGGSGGDRLLGGNGNDTLKGQSGKDYLNGGAGDDYLDGGADVDRLIGGKGNDVLMDYEGGDRLTGGSGADVFGVGSPMATQASVITDFKRGTDQVKILRLGATFEDLSFRQSRGGTTVLDQGKAIAFLSGIKAQKLSADDFTFGDAQLASILQTNLNQFLAENQDTTGLAATVFAPDGTLWSGFAGAANRATQTPVDANSLFSIGSITKPMIATTILQLRDEGKLSLDDTLSQWLPELSSQIPNSDRITIQELLNHTSGIREYLTDPGFIEPLTNDPDLANQTFTPEQLVSFIAGKPALFEPGQQYSYSNTGYILLGEVIETATQSTITRQLHQRIFDPLGMKDTFYAPEEQVKGNWVQGYIDLDGDGQLDPLNETLSWAGAAGGVVSTSADIAKFSQALFSGELLAPATLNAMLYNNIATDGEEFRYGSGIGVTNIFSELGEVWGHSGATFVSQAQMYHLPEHNVTATVVATSPLENIIGSLVFENLQDTVKQYQGGGILDPEVSLSLPTLTGEFAGGTLTYGLTDFSRDETFTPDPTDQRQVDIQIWYPSQLGTNSSTPSYLNDVTQALFADAGLPLPNNFLTSLQEIHTRSTPDAPIATNFGKYPVIVFSPGLGTPSQTYLTLVEELASQGYIVVGLNHTDLPEESFENPENLLATLQQRVADTKFVLNQLEILNKNDPNGILTGRLDLDRVGILGHSFGGATAAEAMGEDARFDAGINMDGTFFGDVVTQGLDRPFMLVNAESTATFDSTQQQFFDNLHGSAYQVTLKDAGHHNFSDLAFLTSLFPNTGLSEQVNQVTPTPSNPNPMPIDPTVALDITNDYLRAFFDQYLKSQPAPLLNSVPTHSAISYTARIVETL